MEERKIFLDNASTTPISNEVLREMMPALTTTFGNANSFHCFGREAYALVDIARNRVATALGAKAEEIYFTSGGSESNNLAIKGIARANRFKGNHIITSCIEHDSIISACQELEREGFEVTYLSVDKDGLINFVDFLDCITSKTILISIMTANNEIATIQHINAISQTARENGIIFHTDAVQAVSSVKFNLAEMKVDALTVSSHKLYGPKGAGCLYVREGVIVDPIIGGGNQERGLRAGTQNVPAIVGFGKAIEIAVRDIDANNRKLRILRDYFMHKIVKAVPNISFNGHQYQRVPNIISISFNAVNNESLATLLDMEGIAVSIGSACDTGSIEPSHVLKAIGKSEIEAREVVRFSISKYNTNAELDYVIEKVAETVEKLRNISPVKIRKKSVEV